MTHCTCMCHQVSHCQDCKRRQLPTTAAATASSVNTRAAPLTDVLPGIAATEVLETLKAILTQLQLLNNYSSQVDIPSNNMQLIQDEKLDSESSLGLDPDSIIMQPNSKAQNSLPVGSVNWTSEHDKWATPINENINWCKSQILNPIHSTPVAADPIKIDLLSIFDNIDTDDSSVNDLSVSINTITLKMKQ